VRDVLMWNPRTFNPEILEFDVTTAAGPPSEGIIIMFLETSIIDGESVYHD